MSTLIFVTHPEVVVDPGTDVVRWHLSDVGIARMRQFARSDVARGVSTVWASTETKAIEAAGLLAGWLGLPVNACAALGENDRSSTGFLLPDEFEKVADSFFAKPEQSVRGWERAVDAQVRVRAAADAIVAGHRGGDLAIVAHGAVGTLLLCSFLGREITRAADQPAQGCYWTATLPDCKIAHAWRPILTATCHATGGTSSLPSMRSRERAERASSISDTGVVTVTNRRISSSCATNRD